MNKTYVKPSKRISLYVSITNLRSDQATVEIGNPIIPEHTDKIATTVTMLTMGNYLSLSFALYIICSPSQWLLRYQPANWIFVWHTKKATNELNINRQCQWNQRAQANRVKYMLVYKWQQQRRRRQRRRCQPMTFRKSTCIYMYRVN